MKKEIPVLIAVIAECACSRPLPPTPPMASVWHIMVRQCHVIDGSGPSATLPQGPPSFRVAAGRAIPASCAPTCASHGAMPDLTLARSRSTI